MTDAQKKAQELTQSLARLCRPVERPRYIFIADRRGRVVGCAPPQKFAGLDSLITTDRIDAQVGGQDCGLRHQPECEGDVEMTIAVINGHGEVYVCDDIYTEIPVWREPSPQEIAALKEPTYDLTPMITEACNATLATIFDTWND